MSLLERFPKELWPDGPGGGPYTELERVLQKGHTAKWKLQEADCTCHYRDGDWFPGGHASKCPRTAEIDRSVWKQQAEVNLQQLHDERAGWKARLFEMQTAAIDLAQQVTRLRALVKEAENSGPETDCPWCDAFKTISGTHHLPDCRAFTREGEVR